MRPENMRIKRWLLSQGVDVTPKWIATGSLKRTWRLHKKGTPWSIDLAEKLNALGFTDYDGKPLGVLSGNGGSFCVFVRGHEGMSS